MQGDVSVKVSNGGFHDVIEDENSLVSRISIKEYWSLNLFFLP